MRSTFGLFACLLTLASPAVASAIDSMPDQAVMDGEGENSTTGGDWSDLPNGPAIRPYIKSISVVNGDESVPVFSGGASAAQGVEVGDVTATISPINLCKAGSSQSGQCYASPNRIGIVFGYKAHNQSIGTDFSRPSVPLRQQVTADSIFDVVIGLNSLGSTLRWTWINGGLDGWKTAGLGTDAGEVRLRIRPAVTPDIDWTRERGGGCTATPIFDCDIQQASGAYLGSNLVLSVDETLDEALTGAAFATTGAIAGFLLPGGSPTEPVLDLQMASAHLAADGSLQQGILEAFIPGRALVDLYGVLPSDAATFFTATRRNDPGTQNAPTFRSLGASDTSDEGLFVSVTGITFSAPTYRVSRRSAPATVRSTSRNGRTITTAERVKACARKGCSVTVYRAAGNGRTVRVASGRTNRSGAARVGVSSSKLRRGAAYLVAIRRAGKLVAAGRGRVG